MKFDRQTLARAAAAASLAVAGAANAAIDVSAATTEIGDVKTGALAVGLAVFTVAVGIKLYKWLRSAL